MSRKVISDNHQTSGMMAVCVPSCRYLANLAIILTNVPCESLARALALSNTANDKDDKE